MCPFGMRSSSPLELAWSGGRVLGLGCKVEGLGFGTAQGTLVSPEGARVMSTLSTLVRDKRGEKAEKGREEGGRANGMKYGRV